MCWQHWVTHRKKSKRCAQKALSNNELHTKARSLDRAFSIKKTTGRSLPVVICLVCSDNFSAENNGFYIHLNIHKNQVSSQTLPDLTAVIQANGFCRIVRSDLKSVYNGSTGVLHVVAASNIQGQLRTGNVDSTIFSVSEVQVGYMLQTGYGNGLMDGLVGDQNDPYLLYESLTQIPSRHRMYMKIMQNLKLVFITWTLFV